MKCPYCGNDEDRVIDSRPARDGKAIRRRRECSSCGSRFTTYEALEPLTTLVIKSDGTRELFDRRKVFRGITIACNKRPVDLKQIEEMTAAVEGHLTGSEAKEIASQQIGQWILDELIIVDEVAYVRFASVFKRYVGLDEFVEELAKIRSVRISSEIN